MVLSIISGLLNVLLNFSELLSTNVKDGTQLLFITLAYMHACKRSWHLLEQFQTSLLAQFNFLLMSATVYGCRLRKICLLLCSNDEKKRHKNMKK